MSSINKYYKLQESHHQKSNFLINQLLNNTVDYWRHSRMYSFIDPILKIEKKSTWLTVGDGRYGHEAHYIESKGSGVVASDISISRLKKAKQANYIGKYKKINAEKISLTDSSYEYILCKESYHHFPRPIIALYEMIRVAKKAVILIEPNDVRKRSLSWKNILGIEDLRSYYNKFEVSGNYVYGITRREIQKVALGIGLKYCAFAAVDDYYIPGVENEKITSNGPLKRKIRIILIILNIAYWLGIRDRSLLVAIIFKQKPSKKLSIELKNAGYDIVELPDNPYT